MRLLVRVPATHDTAQGRQDARLLATGSFGAPWS
jgi:hypothetical protein